MKRPTTIKLTAITILIHYLLLSPNDLPWSTNTRYNQKVSKKNLMSLRYKNPTIIIIPTKWGISMQPHLNHQQQRNETTQQVNCTSFYPLANYTRLYVYSMGTIWVFFPPKQTRHHPHVIYPLPHFYTAKITNHQQKINDFIIYNDDDDDQQIVINILNDVINPHQRIERHIRIFRRFQRLLIHDIFESECNIPKKKTSSFSILPWLLPAHVQQCQILLSM